MTTDESGIISSDELKFLAGYAIGEVELQGLSDDDEPPQRYVVVKLKRYDGLGSEETEDFEVIMTTLQAEIIQSLLAKTAVRVHERNVLSGNAS